MSISGLIFGFLIVVGAFVITYPLVELFVPKSKIDKIDVIGQWAKDELERRGAERREE